MLEVIHFVLQCIFAVSFGRQKSHSSFTIICSMLTRNNKYNQHLCILSLEALKKLDNTLKVLIINSWGLKASRLDH